MCLSCKAKKNQTLYAQAVRPSSIELSEAVSSNKSFLRGSNDTYDDFIELYNNSGSDVSLSDLYITDNSKKLTKAPLPDVTVASGEYLTIICSSSGTNIPKGYHHVAFSLSAIGESIYITDGVNILDSMVVPTLGDDESYGRPASSASFAYLDSATPDATNASGLPDFAIDPQIITKPVNYERWLKAINTMKNCIEVQYPRVYKGVKKFFSLTDAQMIAYGFIKPE